MEAEYRRYPIGIQNFEKLRQRNCVYIDKTHLIYQLAHGDSVYFLSRPRRFGKSLLVSTLEAYFQGKRDLFKGLAIERLEKDWTEYPVLHIDFSASKYMDVKHLQVMLNVQISQWESLYGTDAQEDSFSSRFEGVIRRAYEQTGKQVVVLVDEYDSPLLDSNSNPELQRELRDIVRDFFSPLKKSDQYLRFLFLTGISKFSQLSIFSELNNLKNISMRDEFSALCGITETEMLTELKPDIARMAEANSETYEEACAHLKKQYDGYHFSAKCEDIYNPFSLFNALDSREYKNFWFSTGTPTFLIDLLRQTDFNVRNLEEIEALEEQFDAPTEAIGDPIPVLYQSGYLTIKGYNPMFKTYTLSYPN
ncbi:MAG: AAA family ATPase, partial [Paraprevotella sp.]|nr:AAA family ATPase [Paraprevotella sp.]